MGKLDKNFIVYKASAGSGKTYTLVKEYLKIVLSNPEKYRRVLAVTFTNKAAYEMKNRIINYLLQLSGINNLEDQSAKESIKNKYADLIKSLCEETRLKENELSDRADIVLKKILHNYSDFAICTIDSFVQRIIRTFAFDMKIPQNFEVELDSKNVLSQAVVVLLSFATKGDGLTDLLVEFIKKKISEGRNWDIEKDLKMFAEELLKEDTQKFISFIEHFTIDDFKISIAKSTGIKKTLSTIAENTADAVLNEIRKLQIEESSFFQGSRGIPSFFKKVSKSGLANAGLSSSYYSKTVVEGEWYSRKAPAQDTQNIDSLKEIICQSYFQIMDLQLQFKNISIITKSLYPLSLLNLIKAEVDEIKSGSNLIFISDFYQKIHEQLLNEPVPFIYQRTGEKYEHFFIDEFQDTSVLQFQNMLPLIENSLAAANTNLVVGDGKQAIYRWRSGEVMQFASLPKIFNKPDQNHFDDIENTLERNFINYADSGEGALNINYRSQAEIVNFNNKLFGFLSGILSAKHRDIYANTTQNVKAGNTAGYVELRFLDKDDYEKNQLSSVFEIIENLSAKNIALNQIAVICRKNTETIKIASHLLKNHIAVVSSESLLLSASKEVNLIIALLRFMNNPNDNLSASYVLFYANRNHQPAETTHSVFEQFKHLFKSKGGYAAMAEILRQFNFEIDFSSLARLTLFDLNEGLIRLFGLLNLADPFVVFYLDALSGFVQKNTATIFDFLEWWDEFGFLKSIVIPDELNAVKIMTIHKAKGQEFPVVIYAFADELPKVKDASAWFKNTNDAIAELPVFRLQINEKLLAGSSYEAYFVEEKEKVVLDMLNVCYVALTRAEDQLYVISKQCDAASKSQSFGVMLQRFLKAENLWEDGKVYYEFGDKQIYVKNAIKKQPDPNHVFEGALVSSDWTKKLLIRYNSLLAFDFDVQDKLLAWGNLVHEVLSGMNDIDDMEMLLAGKLSQFLSNEQDSLKIRELLATVFAKPEIAAFFAPRLHVLTEAEILTPDNRIYRPDRVIFGHDKNTVIDFKTGAEEEKHREQLANYATLLTEINGKPTEKYLLYLHGEVNLVKV
ncbi:MAG: UvrD-helicase domain-containing protein [Bacteroidota bacterium]